MTRTDDHLRIGAAICLLVVCILTAYDSAHHVGANLFQPSMVLDFVLGLITLATWILMVAGAVGLLKRRRWGYWLVYVAALLNIVPGYVFIPFLGDVIVPMFNPEYLFLIVFGINVGFVILVMVSHSRRTCE